jgi:tellurite resistance protein TerC
MLSSIFEIPVLRPLAVLAAGGAEVVSWQAWASFGVLVVGALAFDLFRQKDVVQPLATAAAWVAGWVMLAAIFAGGIWWQTSVDEAEIFAAGYLLELALSVDNLFIFLLVFSSFKVPEELRHRVLFWGILGAVFMRALFIFGGVALVERFSILMLVFGAFLLFTGVKMLLPKKEKVHDLEKSLFVRVVRKVFPVTADLDGHRFFTRDASGKRLATRLFLVLVIIEGTDVVFAVDSIPAVIGILPREMNPESKLFLTFTSNIFAVLGLRSLFFAISGFMRYFRFLNYGLAAILVFIGVKMIASEGAKRLLSETDAAKWHISPSLSLAVVGIVLVLSVAASLFFPEKEKEKLSITPDK